MNSFRVKGSSYISVTPYSARSRESQLAKKGKHKPNCFCKPCYAKRKAAEAAAAQAQPGFFSRLFGGSSKNGSTWTPRGSQAPDVGVVAGTDHVVSFKTGGKTGKETLITDGNYSDNPKGFDGVRHNKGHDHHGPWGTEDRGRYTGPGH